MSTRAVVARRAGDGWEGVYHHFDGYPSGLGAWLFRAVRRRYGGDVEGFLAHVLAHDAGWSQVYGPKGGICYCHGGWEGQPGDGWQTSDAHGWGIEWVYVLDPGARVMAVLQHSLFDCADYQALPTARPRPEPPRPCMGLVAVVPLDGPEPDWMVVQCGEGLERCHHYRCLHQAPGCTPDCPYCHGTGRGSRLLKPGETWVDRILAPV